MGARLEPADTLEYDVVIVGCGIAGLAAALAVQETDADAAVLEKAPRGRRGGHLRFTESFRVPTADVDMERYEFHVPEYSASDFYSDIMKVTNGRADQALARRLTSEAGPVVEWLTEYVEEQGMKWETQPPHSGYTAGRTWHDGEQLTDALTGAVREAGADFHFETSATALHRSATGEMEAVDARVEGELVRFECGAVVLASGGYESSTEKRARYYGPGYEHMKVRGSRYNTGEVIDMALEIDAKPEGEWSGAHMAIIDATSPDVEGGITRIDGYQYGVILNHEGERFVDEGEDSRAQTYAKFGRRIFEQPYHEAFIVVDSKVVDDVAHMGPGRPITADSIEGLAHRLDVRDVEQTLETVEEYNAACDPDEYDPNSLDGNEATGIEPPKSNWALPLDDPPFTGYPVTGGITFAFGGLGITPDAEVLDTRDRPIAGLYAAGNSTGGLFHHNYPGGTGLTNGAVFGNIAGHEAAEYALRDRQATKR